MERLARELLEKLQQGKLTDADLAAAKLTADSLRSLLRGIERARSSLASSRGDSSTSPPTFADFLKDFDKPVKSGKKAAAGGGTAASSTSEGSGTLRGVADAAKESVDPEYRDLLEEYYRSLASPAQKKKP